MKKERKGQVWLKKGWWVENLFASIDFYLFSSFHNPLFRGKKDILFYVDGEQNIFFCLNRLLAFFIFLPYTFLRLERYLSFIWMVSRRFLWRWSDGSVCLRNQQPMRSSRKIFKNPRICQSKIIGNKIRWEVTVNKSQISGFIATGIFTD